MDSENFPHLHEGRKEGKEGRKGRLFLYFCFFVFGRTRISLELIACKGRNPVYSFHFISFRIVSFAGMHSILTFLIDAGKNETKRNGL